MATPESGQIEESNYQVWISLNGDPVEKHQCIAKKITHATAVQIRDNEQKQQDIEYLVERLRNKYNRPDKATFYVRKYGEPSYYIYDRLPNQDRHLYKIVYTEAESKPAAERLQKLHDQYKTGAKVFTKRVKEQKLRGELPPAFQFINIPSAARMRLLELLVDIDRASRSNRLPH